MKKVLLYVLLFSYATVTVKPLLPYASDLMAHIFWYSKHMATVHYENGKYHVHYDFLNAAKKDGAEKNSNSIRSSSFTDEHFCCINAYDVSAPYSLYKNYFGQKFYSLPSLHIKGDYPPPRA